MDLEPKVQDLSKQQKFKLTRTSEYRADQKWYSAGVLNVIATTFIIARWPQHFWLLHLLKAVILMPIRYLDFCKRGWQFYMLDFCYFETYLCFLFCGLALLRTGFGFESFLAPYNANFLRVGFFFAFGPLAWSIVIFKNSLAFHNLQKITEVYVHLSPGFLFYCLRWGAGLGPSIIMNAWPDMFRVCPASVSREEMDACINVLWCEACPASFFELTVITPVVYLCFWGIPYYLVVFVLLKDYLQERKLETLYGFMLAGSMKFLMRLPLTLRPLGYIATHLLVTMLFASLAFVFWHCFLAHTLFLLYIISVGIYNGASYVFHDLSFNYAPKVLSRHRSVWEDETTENRVSSHQAKNE